MSAAIDSYIVYPGAMANLDLIFGNLEAYTWLILAVRGVCSLYIVGVLHGC